MASSELLSVRGLRVMYGGIIGVLDIDMTVGSGEVAALLGPNGAGKSSALRGICGEGDVSGKVLFDGKDVSRWSPHRRARAGLVQVPQGGGLFREMSVRENLLLGVYGRPRREREGGLRRAFDLFPQLEERQKVAAGLLSGGEQQMLAMGRALAGAPRMMLLDEPTIGLSPVAVTQVFERIERIAETGVALLIVDQNALKALRLAGQVFVVNRGRLVYAADTATAQAEMNLVDAHLGLVGGAEVDELTGDGPQDVFADELALGISEPIGARLLRGLKRFAG